MHMVILHVVCVRVTTLHLLYRRLYIFKQRASYNEHHMYSHEHTRVPICMVISMHMQPRIHSLLWFSSGHDSSAHTSQQITAIEHNARTATTQHSRTQKSRTREHHLPHSTGIACTTQRAVQHRGAMVHIVPQHKQSAPQLYITP